MRKDLFLHILDIAYPSDQLPIEESKIESIFKRYETTLRKLQLDDTGKVLGGSYFICDIAKGGKDIFQKALWEMDLGDKIELVIHKPETKHLLDVIHELNDREYIVNNVETSSVSKLTTVTFEKEYD